MDVFILVGLLNFLVLIFDSNAKEPCTSYALLGDVDLRQPTNKIKFGRPGLCDRYIEENWYKADSAQMTTTVPGLSSCGTGFPLYLQGEHPTKKDEMKDMTVCKVGFWGPCTSEITIKVKNCNGFYVYYLKSTGTCSSAYCFEYTTQEKAPDEFPTNVVASYTDILWTANAANPNVRRPHLIYECKFDIVPAKDYCYRVIWVIDQKVVHEDKNENRKTGYAKISDDEFPDDDYHLGVTLYCVVGASFCGKDRVGKQVTSKGYFIGLKLQTGTHIKMKELETKTVTFKPTIPFACTEFDGLLDPQPGNRTCQTFIQLKKADEKCRDDIESGSEKCNDEVEGYASTFYDLFYKSKEWEKKEYTLKIVHVKAAITGVAQTSQHFQVILINQANAEELRVWQKETNLARISVEVSIGNTDTVWKGGRCSATGDPHVTNFDGTYFDDHGQGVRYLYVNKDLSQQVQIRNTPCNRPGIKCVCGVAASAGKDVFLMSKCGGVSIIDYVNCEDHTLVVKKSGERSYEVVLPSGTKVVMEMAYWGINVYVYPTLGDTYSTEGLCGHLDKKKDSKDDIFNGRNFRTSGVLNNGIEVLPKDDLFHMTDRGSFENLPPLQSKMQICKCQTDKGKQFTNEITCEYRQFKDCDLSKYTRKLTMPCYVRDKKRKRRSVTMFEDFDIREKRQAEMAVTTFSMTESEALAKCTSILTSSPMYNMCMDKITELGDSFAKDCKLDLMFTGDLQFARSALEGALSSCKIAAERNITLQETQPNITEEIVSQICPNNCSEHGICEKGRCDCEPLYAGADCSFSLLEPPKIVSLSGGGVCDRAVDDCETITFYGDNFLQDANTTCNISFIEGSRVNLAQIVDRNELIWIMGCNCYQKIKTWEVQVNIDSNTTQIVASVGEIIAVEQKFGFDGSLADTSNASLVSGEQYSLFEASCFLSTGSRAFATLFKVSVSNDGYLFTTDYDVINYDSTCQTYDSTLKQVKLKDGFCFIDGNCFAHSDQTPTQRCRYCNIHINNKQWTLNTNHCFINETCFNNKEPDPNDHCNVCLKDLENYDWSRNNHTCVIGGRCFLDGESNPDNRCEVCNMTLGGRFQWSQANDACVIDGQCYANGEFGAQKPCRKCDFKKDRSSWTLVETYCFINGLCIRNGQNNPASPCYQCNATKDQGDWSSKSQYCYIDDSCYLRGEDDPRQSCQVCGEYQGLSHWVLKDEYCYINRFCFKNGQLNPLDPCVECNANTSQTNWTVSENNCVIDGQCYEDGQNNTKLECLYCNKTENRTSWTVKDEDYCFIDGQCFSDNEDSVSSQCLMCDVSSSPSSWYTKNGHCFIDDECHSQGDENQQHNCQICDPSESKSKWSIRSDFCFIGGTCYGNNEQESKDTCRVCNVNKAGQFSFFAMDNYCLINNTCYKDGDVDPQYRCRFCNKTNDRIKWSLTTGHCFIDNQCIRVGEDNPSNDCFHCNLQRAGVYKWSSKSQFCYVEDQCFPPGSDHPIHVCKNCSSVASGVHWVLKSDYCFIESNCYRNEDMNPDDACLECDVNNDNYNWSSSENNCYINGQCFQNGHNNVDADCLYCDKHLHRTKWTLKKSQCYIDGKCYRFGQENSTHPCQICDASDPNNWSLRPDTCFIGGVCVGADEQKEDAVCMVCHPQQSTTEWTLMVEYCLIDNNCYSNEDMNPDDACLECDVNNDTYNWSSSENNCYINGQCFQNEHNNVDADCLYCDKHLHRTKWTLKKSQCYIDGKCYRFGQENSTHPCQICDASDPNKWSLRPDTCFIGGVCVGADEQKEDAVCMVCHPQRSTTEWTLTVEYCLIDNNCYSNEDMNPDDACLECDVNNDTYNWSSSENNCYINGQCFQNGHNNVDADCLYCDKHLHRTKWTLKKSQCYIDGKCYRFGQENSTHPCQICDASDPNKWSLRPDTCFIGEVCVGADEQKEDAVCMVCHPQRSTTEWTLTVEYCLIDNNCYSNDDMNPDDACLECDVNNDTYNWSSSENNCYINGQCFQNGHNNVDADCLYCDKHLHRTKWTLKKSQCYIDGKCYRFGQENSTHPCQICDASDPNKWSLRPDTCFIGGVCVGADEQKEDAVCMVCHPQRSTTEWTLMEEYCLIDNNCYRNGTPHNTISCLNCDISADGPYDWSVAKGYCFIHGQCYGHKQSHPMDKNRICLSDTGVQNTWSKRLGINDEDQDQSLSLTIALIVCGLLVTAGIIVLIVTIYRRLRRGHDYTIQQIAAEGGTETVVNPSYAECKDNVTEPLFQDTKSEEHTYEQLDKGNVDRPLLQSKTDLDEITEDGHAYEKLDKEKFENSESLGKGSQPLDEAMMKGLKYADEETEIQNTA